MNLLQDRDRTRQLRRLQLYHEVRKQLRTALEKAIPGATLYLFGSLTLPGVFNDRSDIDLAFEIQPRGLNEWQLTGELMEELGRRVDLVFLDRCRFADKIRREGEKWTL